MADFLSPSTCSLSKNRIHDKGAMALSDAVKKMPNLQQLKQVDLTTITFSTNCSLTIATQYIQCPSYIFVSLIVVADLPLSIHSLEFNDGMISDVGREALRAAAQQAHTTM